MENLPRKQIRYSRMVSKQSRRVSYRRSYAGDTHSSVNISLYCVTSEYLCEEDIQKAFTEIRSPNSYMNNKIGHESFTERVILKTLTFAVTPLVVMMVATGLLFKGQFTAAGQWIVRDWREPL
ncbi:hypothetical protein HAL_17560 [Haladaptatus sp. T7]|nr:hypothetical protein HAL_17560 [Haladaptatus sp. T7]